MASSETELEILHARSDGDRSLRSGSDGGIDVAAENGQHVGQEFSLPAVDSGKDAWLFLAAAFVVEFLVWGLYCPRHEKLSCKR